MTDWLDRCHFGDVRAVLRRMRRDGVKVNAIVTSPPYWGLRKYLPDGHPAQRFELGHEPTLAAFIKAMAGVFDLARDVLADDGTCWVNMGDSYATDHVPAHSWRRDRASVHQRKRDITGFKDKDLLMQPHRLAIALQDRGWWVRQDIVWNKPNPMPETAKDRPTRSHEYVFQLAKSERYYFNADAFREPVTGAAHPRRKKVAGWAEGAGVTHSPALHNRPKARADRVRSVNMDEALTDAPALRNRRSVWDIPTEPFEGSHYATYPRELVRRCLIGGCPPGGTVLDLFMGSGTTAEVAVALGMRWVGIDLDERNADLQTQRLRLMHRIRQQELAIDPAREAPTLIQERGLVHVRKTTPTLVEGPDAGSRDLLIEDDACYFTARGAIDAAIPPARLAAGGREE
jgi:site-specific DNA-methyltransferase (cytosine-N4-specific)